MSNDITIPPEALEAAGIELYRSATHSPQGFSWATVHPRVRECPAIILPLPQENTNAEG